MARYQYRHTLDLDRNDPTFDAKDRAIIMAAFTLADMAHAHMSRDKIDPQWKYITHPIMAYDIMRKMGENDPITLAGMLLHDTVEKDSEFAAHPDLLDTAFQSILRRDTTFSADESAAISKKVMALVHEVTNPLAYPEGKEMEQVDRAAQMSFPAKKIKIADQASSLACNLTMENNTEAFTPAQAENFADKAYSLVGAILRSPLSEKEAGKLYLYDSMFAHCHRAVRPLLDAKSRSARETLRDQFDFHSEISSPEILTIVPPKDIVAHSLDFSGAAHTERLGRIGAGLHQVDFDAYGKVSRFVLHVAPDADKGHEANAIQRKLVEELRTRRKQKTPYDKSTHHPDPQRGNVITGDLTPITPEDGTPCQGRVYQLVPPLHAYVFAQAARAVQACSVGEAERIRATGQHLKKTARLAHGQFDDDKENWVNSSAPKGEIQERS